MGEAERQQRYAPGPWSDRTFCASPCATRGCPRHQDNVPSDTKGLPVVWGFLHGTCSDYRRSKQ